MTVYVITHKNFKHDFLPNHYVPLLVGANGKNNKGNFLTDNTGDNISEKNNSFCEETGLYWMWKNCDDKYIGLSHYRRFFTSYRNRKEMFLFILLKGKVKPISVNRLNGYLNNEYDWIVSQPEHSGKESLWSQFDYIHNINDLKVTEEVIKRLYPDSLGSFEKIMKHNESASFYNMFYTTKKNMDEYCKWLFDILFEVENLTDISNYDNYQQRLYGFLSERLLNVWLDYKKVKVKYLPVYENQKMDRQYVIDLFKGKS